MTTRKTTSSINDCDADIARELAHLSRADRPGGRVDGDIRPFVNRVVVALRIRTSESDPRLQDGFIRLTSLFHCVLISC
jgi:hypothetical protein